MEQIKNLMLAWRDRTLPAVQSLLAQFFTSADRVLIEYAEKAESEAVRSRFYEGQRELWRRQDEVAGDFSQGLSRELFAFTRPAGRRDADAPGAEVLSLVGKDEYELSLALQTITDQAIKHNNQLYYALAQRLGKVAGVPPLPYEKLPAGPHQLAAAFEAAAGRLEAGREVLLALYTLFEREVIRESTPWHEDLNEVLREAGVLPHLRYEIRRQPGEGGPARTRDQSTAARYGAGTGAPRTTGPRRFTGIDIETDKDAAASAASGQGQPQAGADAALGDQLLGRIRDLLTARRRYQSAVSGEPMRPDPVNPAPAEAVAEIIDSPQVQEAVDFPEAALGAPPGKRVVVSRELLEKLRSALSVQRSMIKRNVGHDRLSHFDEDTIDIVGMLFEQMLNDDRLGNTVKTVLSHLHTPFLKLAVRDTDFLRSTRHPARRLFDRLVEAGSHWVDEDRPDHGLFPRLRSIVESVLQTEDPSQGLFADLAAGLEADVERLENRQQVREQRTIATERGQARLAEARAMASGSAREICAGRPGPAYYERFVNGPWIDYLALLRLRAGSDDEWAGALKLGRRLQRLVDDIVAGARPPTTELDAVQEALAQRLGGVAPHYQAEVENLFAQLAADTGGDVEEIQIGGPPAAAPRQAAAAGAVELRDSGRALLQRLPQLPEGSWVAFHDGDGPDKVVKLSWFNPRTQRFLFVDRDGAKALALSLPEFADRIDREHARVMHDTAKSYVETSLQRALKTLQTRA